MLWRFTSRDEVEAAQATHQDWVEQVQGTQGSRMSFSEAAARYVGGLPPPLEVHDPIPYERFYQDRDAQSTADSLVVRACAVESALEFQRLQELHYKESAPRTHDEADWTHSYESREAFERATQEASDHEYAQQLARGEQAGDPEFPEFVHYDPAGTTRDEQEEQDRQYAQRLANEDNALFVESTGPRTRTQAGRINAVVEDSDNDDDDDDANASNPPVAIIRLANAGPEDLDVECARYDAAKRAAREDSIG
jgi:hypothetical protein